MKGELRARRQEVDVTYIKILSHKQWKHMTKTTEIFSVVILRTEIRNRDLL
jgi:hypothetical protein